NVFTSLFMEALDDLTHELINRDGIKAAVFRSGKPEGFIAGANVDEIEQISTAEEATEKSRTGQLIFQKIADLPFPTIAAVNGHCMGGGGEFILACDYRLAAQEGASIGFPEIKLGLFPGWGGTQRLPRLISLQTTLDMILTGKSYSADRSLKAGLIDKAVPDNMLDEYARDFAIQIIAKSGKKIRAARKKKQRGFTNLLLEKNRYGRHLIWRKARENVRKKTGGHYPAPLRTIEVIKNGLATTLEEGLQIEAREFGKLFTTPEHKNLLHVYRLNERPKQRIGIREDAESGAIDKVAVLGAGVMGGGIAQLLAYNDFPVRLKDIDPERVTEGLRHAESVFDEAVRRHKLSSLEKERKFEHISGSVSYDGFQKIDLLIEAVVENMTVKQQVLQEAEDYLPESCIFASNTSALSISAMQKVARHPERVAGMHFFNPVHRMPLVEVIRGEHTSETTMAAIFALARQLGKTPIVVRDSPGFLVNRLLGIYLNEACLLAEEGHGIQWIDHIVREFGMPMGPFRLMDEVGIDIAAEVAGLLGKAFEEYLEPSILLRTVHDAGFPGKKGNSGFYIYRKNQSQGINPEIRKYVPEDKSKQSEDALKRMLYLMVNEAGRCLEDDIVAGPEDVDMGMIFGTGFPPFRGGLCTYADAVGLPDIVRDLESFQHAHGIRFQPCDYLQSHDRFYKE
ncbi:MAG TPA: 3-hydroxyacyl-CoA dehydrogenase NAD-binding domain-containing protein, partial [bacterium]|nr:3-hydroxyacyl-CoA dehydrogenase NAD-binding domain-containing protein [bacterium]